MSLSSAYLEFATFEKSEIALRYDSAREVLCLSYLRQILIGRESAFFYEYSCPPVHAVSYSNSQAWGLRHKIIASDLSHGLVYEALREAPKPVHVREVGN